MVEPSKAHVPSAARRVWSVVRGAVHAYHTTALVVLNTFVLFLIANLALLAVFHVRDRLSGANPVEQRYGPELLREVYPHRSEREIEALLAETWSRKFLYEPYTQFSEAPYRGDYVNVDAAGFRHGADQGPWPPEPGRFNVFVFGGSTAFGYGVADNETIPSRLQQDLAGIDPPVRVYNFGRGHYFSTQERILFTQLLAAGHTPDAAVFIDGLNDFYYAATDEPLFTRRLRRVTQDPESRARELLSQLPLSRAIRGMRGLFGGRPDDREAGPEVVSHPDDEVIEGAVGRYVANKSLIEAVAAPRGIPLLFVWQPVPTFDHDPEDHPFSLPRFSPHNYSKHGYVKIRELFEDGRLGDNFVWCADSQRGQPPPLYVDVVHYSAQFSTRIAACISSAMRERGVVS